jgi:hypothetical protein
MLFLFGVGPPGGLGSPGSLGILAVLVALVGLVTPPGKTFTNWRSKRLIFHILMGNDRGAIAHRLRRVASTNIAEQAIPEGVSDMECWTKVDWEGVPAGAQGGGGGGP